MKFSNCSVLVLATFSVWAQPARIHPALANLRSDETVRVIVQYRDGLTEKRDEHVRARGGRVHHDLDLVRGHAVSLRADQIEELASDPDVESISPDNPVFATMDT